MAFEQPYFCDKSNHNSHLGMQKFDYLSVCENRDAKHLTPYRRSRNYLQRRIEGAVSLGVGRPKCFASYHREPSG
jgi:hypothetical protein